MLVAVLVVQGVIDWRSTTEAFPTVSMPTFGQAPDRDGHRTIGMLAIDVVHQDGSQVRVEPEELFSEFHYSSARFAIDNVFRSEEPISQETRQWLGDQVRRISGGSDAKSVTFTWQSVDLDIVAVSTTPLGEPTVREVEL
ncbi:hypothetical protein SAMN05880568_2732 [Microbacterium sp. RURRCA19A]|nr:hypothetical protein SAMN05880568_2732 [Microbacterium sp. RURRCA19A]